MKGCGGDEGARRRGKMVRLGREGDVNLPRDSNAEIHRKCKCESVQEEDSGGAACAGECDVCFALDDDARRVT